MNWNPWPTFYFHDLLGWVTVLMGASYFFLCLQVVVVLQQVFQLIQKVLSKWLNDAQVVEVSPDPAVCPMVTSQRKSRREVLLPH